MDYSERRCRFLGAAYAGYDGRCKLQQTSAFCSLLGRPCHLFPLLLASQVGTHYSIWLFEMEYSRWPRRTPSRWGHFYFEPGPVARCRLNKSLISDCYPWPIAEIRPSPRESAKPADLNPAGFCMTRNSGIRPSLNRPFQGKSAVWRVCRPANVARRAAV